MKRWGTCEDHQVVFFKERHDRVLYQLVKAVAERNRVALPTQWKAAGPPPVIARHLQLR